ncbi:MAG: hypothetical protein DRJ61_09235 [Acidobacteria bacterium]|nr:MAG: hypothetical protein DRJ61_09235 [Acidobacteriota bacterium]
MKRDGLLRRIDHLFRVNPVVALLGPRQCGKTTLARFYVERFRPDFPQPLNYFDLEDPDGLSRLSAPKLALQNLRGLVVIDEIQRSPELFPLLRTLVDRPDVQCQFLILGSASRDLIRQSSETLAGRISSVEVAPFSAAELQAAGQPNLLQLWLRGGFPPAYLAEDAVLSSEWRAAYVSTYLERDLPALGIQIPAATMRRFWMMLVHYHGQVFNASELGTTLGVADTTISRYLDILTGTFMVRRLQPWFENVKKRQRRRPKIYFRDSGVLHTLLGITDDAQLQLHPKLGASWEGFALEEVIRLTQSAEEEVFYWGVHQQAELDLLICKGGRKIGFEFKYADAPRLDRSMRRAFELLELDQLQIVFPGQVRFPLAENIDAVGLARLVEESAFSS